MSRLKELKAQRAQLDELIKSGVLSGDAARQARARLEAEIVATVAPAALATQAGAAPAATEPAARPSIGLTLGLLAFVLLFGVAGYAWLGNPSGLALAPGVAAPAQAEAGGHAPGKADIEAMAQRLAERLKATPDDVEGWTMLGRSYNVLERYPEALAAFQHVLSLRPGDAQANADVADAMGMANGRKLDGEPEKLIARALELDPDNPKALGLAGTVAFDRGDYATAARHWERALARLEPGTEMADRLRGAVSETRQRAGLPPLPENRVAAAPGPTVAAAAGATASPAPAPGGAAAAVQARISLAPALAAKAAPEDTVFIFARSPVGGKAPLAIQRRQVKDLPLDVTLDDSMAMSPAMRLSSVPQVIIGARISKSGNAMPQPGDLQGLSPVVAVGTRGLVLQISEVVP